MTTPAPHRLPATSAPQWRVAPSVPVATGVFVAYVAAFIGLSATSGIPFEDWFATGANAFRTAVIPLLAGSVVLVAFVLWARWDWVFQDAARLPVHRSMRVATALFAVGFVVHLVVADWPAVPTDLLLAIVVAGVLVGFAEETLFRGIILRSLRDGVRPEAWVMLISSLWFGFFHLTNLLNGSPLGGVITQCLLATAAGVVLYSFRRVSGLLVVAMIAHGLWDMSVFLPSRTGGIAAANLAIQVLVTLAALVAAVVVLRRDRAIVASAAGVQSL